MPRKRLTKTIINSTPSPAPGSPRIVLTDADAIGLALEINATSRTWYMRVSIRNRVQRIRIGSWPAWSVEQARERALTIRRRLEAGQPIDDPAPLLTLATFWADHYLPHATAKLWRPSTTALNVDHWTRAIAPALGTTPIGAITRAAAERLHAAHAATPTRANQILRLLRAILNHAIHLEHIERNPAAGIAQFRRPPRERFLSSAEYARLFAAIDAAESHGGLRSVARIDDPDVPGRKRETAPRGITPHTAAALRVLVYTGARLREITRAEWTWLNLERSCLDIPDAASKTGRKSLHLPPQALDEITRLWPIRRQDRYIFEDRGGAKPIDRPTSAWRRLCRAAAIDPPPRIHDLRHSYASAAVALGAPLKILGAQLGHANAATTDRYAHLDRSAVAELADQIAAAIAGLAARPTATIIPADGTDDHP
jgi:integrase